MNDELVYYLEKLRRTKSEDAFFSLLHLDEKYIPLLITAYRSEKDPSIQALLVEIIWQHRSIKFLNFLGEVLEHANMKVWQCALDGIAALPHESGLSILQRERQRLLDPMNDKDDPDNSKERIKWIDEAVEQIRRELLKS